MLCTVVNFFFLLKCTGNIEGKTRRLVVLQQDSLLRARAVLVVAAVIKSD